MKAKPPEKRKVGRPSKYTEAVVQSICTRMVQGESLRTICKDEKMPGLQTVLDWLDAKEDFRGKYAHARELQADALAEECLEIADDGTNDWMEKKGNNPGYDFNGEAAARSRLRLEQRRWYASKLAPKKYGDKLDLTSGGNPLPAPVVMIKPAQPSGGQ